MGYRVLIACSKPSVGLPWLFWALVTSWYFEFKILCNTFFSPFLKLLDCCWIVFLLPQGTNWAIQRSATKQTDVDEMRGSTFHWYLVSNNPDDFFANVTDEHKDVWGWSWCALPSANWSSFQISCHSTTSSLVNLVNGGLCTFILLGNYQWTIPPPPFLSAN